MERHHSAGVINPAGANQRHSKKDNINVLYTDMELFVKILNDLRNTYITTIPNINSLYSFIYVQSNSWTNVRKRRMPFTYSYRIAGYRYYCNAILEEIETVGI